MIYKKIDLGIDIDKLKHHLETIVKSLPPYTRSGPYRGLYGGWSITSSTGEYTDGWHQGQLVAKIINGTQKLVRPKDGGTEGIPPLFEFNKPTEIYNGYLAEIIEKLELLGLTPRRARIIFLKPKKEYGGKKFSIHRDGLPNEYNVRLHIPIITNPECFFIRNDGSTHMPADGNGYLIRVNKLYSEINIGENTRYHIITNVKDTKKISRHHQFNGFFDES